ncbi:hypothetical protein [Natronomonas amylolytica]|uniref:hypothetical protein n=1 Tax=Natronomonas amylolytica TaxID=3108498 RepID=UPI003008F7E3
MVEDDDTDPVIEDALGQIQTEVNQLFRELRREPWMPQLEKEGEGSNPMRGAYHTLSGAEENQMSTDDWIYYVTGKIEGMEKAAYVVDQTQKERGE